MLGGNTTTTTTNNNNTTSLMLGNTTANTTNNTDTSMLENHTNDNDTNTANLMLENQTTDINTTTTATMDAPNTTPANNAITQDPSSTTTTTTSPSPPKTSTSYLCTTCQITFTTSQDQRAHMKEAWHVYNIKRRIASLDPISHQVFTDSGIKGRDVYGGKSTKREKKEKINEAVSRARSAASSRSRSSSGSNVSVEEEVDDVPDAGPATDGDYNANDDNDHDDTVSPCQCLFCAQNHANNDEGFAANMEHMRSLHGLYVPDQDRVIDLQTFVAYLATEVRVWNECLYCGAVKDSVVGIQSHMRDKGHCAVNLEREPELLEFWEGEEGEEGVRKIEGMQMQMETEMQMRVEGGRVVESRHAVGAKSSSSSSSRKKGPARSREIAAQTAATIKALEDAESDASSSSEAPQRQPQSGTTLGNRQLALREAMGITGISEQQRHALVLAEKKAQRSEAVARRAREWVYASGANKQKYDQIDGSRKHGKQNHKLQPR